MPMTDGRNALPDGRAAWKFDEHGFCYIKAPEPVADFLDRKLVEREYAPRVLEAVRAATGAKRAFWMSHQRRAEPEVDKASGGRQDMNEGYATGIIHTDYGPAFEEQFRTVLHRRYGLSAEEASTCGLCVANMWVPVDRPAFKDPLVLLDCTTLDVEKETIPWQLHQSIDNGYDSAYKDGGSGFSQRPREERVPQAAADAPSLSPVHNPNHRFVYLPDMTVEEAAVFKQYDYRKVQPAKASFHMSFRDPFHKDWKECPGRRSLECRVILTYDPDTASSSSKL